MCLYTCFWLNNSGICQNIQVLWMQIKPPHIPDALGLKKGKRKKKKKWCHPVEQKSSVSCFRFWICAIMWDSYPNWRNSNKIKHKGDWKISLLSNREPVLELSSEGTLPQMRMHKTFNKTTLVKEEIWIQKVIIE